MTLCLQEGWEKAQILTDLAFIDSSLLPSALDVIRKMPLIGGKAYLLSKAIPLDSQILPEVIQILNEDLPKTNEIALKDQKMRVMHELASQDSRWLPNALHATLDNINDPFAGIFLVRLSRINIELLPFVCQEIRKIKDIKNRAECLSELSSVDINLFSEAYQTTLSVEPEGERKNALSLLAQYNYQLRGAALKASQLTHDSFYLAEIISQVAKFSEHYFAKALEIALSIEYECSRSNTLSRLTHILPLALLPKVFEAIEHIESPTERARVFTEIARRDEKFFPEALDAVRNAQDDYWKTSFLISLSEKHDCLVPEALFALRSLIYDVHRGHLLHKLILQLPKSILNQAFEATQFVESMSLRARNLCTLAIRESSFLPEALNVARKIQGDIDKARCLRQLSSHYKQYLSEALQATLDIHEENHRVNELIELICLDSDLFLKALKATQRIKDPLARVQNLIKLAEIDEVVLPDAFEAVAYIQDEYQQALQINSIAQKFPNLFLSKAIEITRNLQDPYCRAHSFSDLIPQILNMIDFDLWKELLHNIANLERRSLLDNIPKLRLAIVSLGGTVALDESIKAMQDVTKWWP